MLSIEREHSREDSESQQSVDRLAHLAQLEANGIHTDSLVKQEKGPLKIAVKKVIRNIHRRINRTTPL